MNSDTVPPSPQPSPPGEGARRNGLGYWDASRRASSPVGGAFDRRTALTDRVRQEAPNSSPCPVTGAPRSGAARRNKAVRAARERGAPISVTERKARTKSGGVSPGGEGWREG